MTIDGILMKAMSSASSLVLVMPRMSPAVLGKSNHSLSHPLTKSLLCVSVWHIILSSSRRTCNVSIDKVYLALVASFVKLLL